jgi:hypothetical protein
MTEYVIMPSQLRKAFADMQDDLLIRAEIGSGGERVVNVSASVWDAFCEALDAIEAAPQQAEQPAAIPTIERLPTEADADYSGAVFAFTAFTKEWVLQHWAHVADCPNAYLYWQKTGLTRPSAPGGE